MPRSPATARARSLVLLLGSNIGNFDTPAARAFLRRIRRVLQPGDLLLLGADLVKPAHDLQLAYDDPLGVTAAFNKNLLVRINRELGGTFNLAAFDHRASWNSDEQRIEMHLVSAAAQTVTIAAAEMSVSFLHGEHIWTESSYKVRTGSDRADGRARRLRPALAVDRGEGAVCAVVVRGREMTGR